MSFTLIHTVALAKLPGASRLEARVLAILAVYADDEGKGVFVSIKRICEEYEMPAGSVRRAMRRMTKAGWIVDVGRHRNTAGQLTNIRSRRIDVGALGVKLVSEPKKKGAPVPIWDPSDHPVDQGLRSPGGQSLRSPGGQSLRSPGGQPIGTSDGTSDGSNNPPYPQRSICEDSQTAEIAARERARSKAERDAAFWSTPTQHNHALTAEIASVRNALDSKAVLPGEWCARLDTDRKLAALIKLHTAEKILRNIESYDGALSNPMAWCAAQGGSDARRGYGRRNTAPYTNDAWVGVEASVAPVSTAAVNREERPF